MKRYLKLDVGLYTTDLSKRQWIGSSSLNKPRLLVLCHVRARRITWSDLRTEKLRSVERPLTTRWRRRYAGLGRIERIVCTGYCSLRETRRPHPPPPRLSSAKISLSFTVDLPERWKNKASGGLGCAVGKYWIVTGLVHFWHNNEVRSNPHLLF